MSDCVPLPYCVLFMEIICIYCSAFGIPPLINLSAVKDGTVPETCVYVDPHRGVARFCNHHRSALVSLLIEAETISQDSSPANPNPKP